MRIGIITLSLFDNYGGILQAYALQTSLERLGHKVVVLNKIPYFELPSNFTVFRRYIIKYLLRKNIDIYTERETNKRIKKSFSKDTELLRKTRRFSDKYINHKDISYFQELCSTDFDAFVVGSDQCWRPIYAKPIQGYYLDFAKSWKIKRIAYAASFGVDKWEYTNSETLKCKKLVKKFDAVSVREDSGVGLCKTYFGIDVEHVLDPTMLLQREDYITLVDEFKQKCESQHIKGLFCYMLDITEQKKTLIDSVSKAWGMETTLCSDFCIEEWLDAFYSANVILVDSFHGAVFSIIFNKPFWVIGNAKRGNARFSSLLKMFGLEDRLIDSENYALVDWMAEINWDRVNDILEIEKKKSIEFIVDNLR